jgi:hydroxymethylpyrimidine pyrophosphatase-like HAD family hydrolase
VQLLALADRAAPAIPILGSDVIVLPACFRDFDQRPEDARWLADELISSRQIPMNRPVWVVGVRTSGCYLAPLLVAALRARGRLQANLLTHRKGRPFLGRERAALRSCARADGLVLVTDDPPETGSSLVATACAVAAAGIADESIVMTLSLFGDADELPEALRRWPSVVQRWPDWAVQAQLTPDALRAGLASVLAPGWKIEACGPVSVSASKRSHVRAYFQAQLTATDGRSESRNIVVEGTGQGYLGRHPAAVASRLRDLVPRVYGFRDGLLYQEWLPAPDLPQPTRPSDAAVDYIAARQRLLPVDSDPTPMMRNRQAVWEIAAQVLSGMYGPLGPAARLLLLEPMTRALLAVATMSIVDGDTRWQHWLPDPDNTDRLRKAEFGRWAFSNRELACYDAVYDLAGVAADPPDQALAVAVRSRFEQLTGQRVDGERWLLYRLAQLWGLRRRREIDPTTVRRQSAVAVHDYLAETYGLGSPGQQSGPLCAIDLDGVLETDPLGYPVTSPAGTLALRALKAHGFSPVLATGRQLNDVRDRCRAFGLIGGTAEYGAVIFRTCDELVVDMRSDAERALIEKVRDELPVADRRIEVDADYRYSVRARYAGGPVPAHVISALPMLADSRLRIIQGQGQTDIVVADINKATGLRELRSMFGGAPLLMAVGDSAEDLPLLSTAAIAWAPRNADAAVRAAGVPRARYAYQSGLSHACAKLLGHRPGYCPVCQPAAFPRRTRIVLTALGLREDDLRCLPERTAALAFLIARDRLHRHFSGRKART